MSRVVLIHAVTVAMAPVEQAFASLWPEAERVHLLDDSLSLDHERAGRLTPAMVARFQALAGYARMIGARGILFTCSAFGEAIEAVARDSDVPVLKPNQAMFEDALGCGSRIGMLATFGPSVSSMAQEFAAAAAALRPGATIETVLVEGALPALKEGDAATHDRLLAAAAPRLAACDAVMLAHFSTSRAQAGVQARLDCPVLTAPGSAVLRLRQALQGRIRPSADRRPRCPPRGRRAPPFQVFDQKGRNKRSWTLFSRQVAGKSRLGLFLRRQEGPYANTGLREMTVVGDR